MVEKHDTAPAEAATQLEPTHLVITEDVDAFRKGMIIPNSSEIAKRLSGKTRPATQFDLGVAGIVTRRA